MRIFGLILAGGQARRMGGRDKALLTLAGQSLISHVVARLEPQVDSLAISANGDPARFTLGLPVLPDAAAHGPLSGILAGLIWAQTHGATALVTVPVDGPFLPPDLVPRLCLAAEATGTALAASAGNLHPTYGLWPVTLTDALRDFLNSGAKPRVRDFAMAHHAATARFPDDTAFTNLNTQADLARLETLLTAP